MIQLIVTTHLAYTTRGVTIRDEAAADDVSKPAPHSIEAGFLLSDREKWGGDTVTGHYRYGPLPAVNPLTRLIAPIIPTDRDGKRIEAPAPAMARKLTAYLRLFRAGQLDAQKIAKARRKAPPMYCNPKVA